MATHGDSDEIAHLRMCNPLLVLSAAACGLRYYSTSFTHPAYTRALKLGRPSCIWYASRSLQPRFFMCVTISWCGWLKDWLCVRLFIH